jgi:hypothetical protein
VPAALTEAGCLAVFLVVASGWGGFIPEHWWGPSARRTCSAGCVLGWLVFASFYAIAAQLAAPFSVALGGTAVILIAGALGLVRAGRRNVPSIGARLAVALGIAVYWIVGSDMSGNTAAIDPWYYAASPFLLFKSDWLAANVGGLADASGVQTGVELVALSRAGATASLWPIALGGFGLAALGVGGLRVGCVAEAGIGLLLAEGAVSSELLDRSSPRWLGALIGVAGTGVYNAIAVLTGGQIQQATALLTMLGSVWLARTCTSPAGRLIALALGGFVVSAIYPEFIIAAPLYVVMVAVAQRQHALGTAAQFGALCIEWVAEQTVTLGCTLIYLIQQSTGLPGWAPLPSTPSLIWEVIVDVILQTRPPLFFYQRLRC